MKKINFSLSIIILVAIIILGCFIYLSITEKQYSINAQERKESCIKNSIERLEKTKSRNDEQGLVINATWKYSNNNDICYYIESQTLISSFGTVYAKYIYNLNTNQTLHYSLTNGNGYTTGGISKEEINKIEANILEISN